MEKKRRGKEEIDPEPRLLMVLLADRWRRDEIQCNAEPAAT